MRDGVIANTLTVQKKKNQKSQPPGRLMFTMYNKTYKQQQLGEQISHFGLTWRRFFITRGSLLVPFGIVLAQDGLFVDSSVDPVSYGVAVNLNDIGKVPEI